MFKAVKSTVKSQIITVTSLCLIVLLMGIFFASQSYSTAVEAVKINKNPIESKWDLKFSHDYYKELEGSKQSTYHRIHDNVAVVDTLLNAPHEYIEYVIMIENKGNMDAVLNRINVEGLNQKVECTMKLNNEVFDTTKENVIKANEKAYITVRVEYKETTEQVMPISLRLITSVEYK